MVFLWDLSNLQELESIRPDYVGEFRADPLIKEVAIEDPFPLIYRRLVGEVPLITLAFFLALSNLYIFVQLEQMVMNDPTNE